MDIKLEEMSGLNFNLLKLFPTPVYITEADNNVLEDIQTELYSVYNKLSNDGLFQHKNNWNTQHLSDPSFTGNFFNYYNCNNFLNFLSKHIKSYLFINGVIVEPDYEITESWFTLTKNKEYAHIHNHGTSDISGCYYLQTNGEDGDFTIPCSQKPLDMQFRLFPNITKSLVVPPQVGRMILFPGWMDHGIKTNMTDNDRVSISFNIKVHDVPKQGSDVYA